VCLWQYGRNDIKDDKIHSNGEMMKRIIILLFVLFVIAFPAQAQMQWVTGYFGTWLKWDAPATDFDWSNMTHCIIFGENPVATSPYFVPSQYGLLVDGDLSL
jgi:hypothetical protein